MKRRKQLQKEEKLRNGFCFLGENNDGISFLDKYKDGFHGKVKLRERPLALGRGGELGGSGLEFKGSHHLIVSANILEALALVLCQVPRRRHGRAKIQTSHTDTHRERERERERLGGYVCNLRIVGGLGLYIFSGCGGK
jgi:hypothetical protein